MIKRIADYVVSVVSPAAAVRRQYARKIERAYDGARPDRLSAHQNPKNQSPNTELQGPWGADAARAWARMLVRDNDYAWAALEAIVSNVVGEWGFQVTSKLESPVGEVEPDTNANREKTWSDWCETADLNGELCFEEIQMLAFREVVEAGECLLHWITPPDPDEEEDEETATRKALRNGMRRPVPLAIEMIDADRLASDHDTYAIGRNNEGTKTTRGIEMDENGKVLAYWIYPSHPTEPNVFARTPERIPAHRITHIFRKDRIGQSRGVTWFSPIIKRARSLGTYEDNEMQASAVASCQAIAITTEHPMAQGKPPSTNTATTDADGNQYEFLQPGMVMNLRPGEKIESAAQGRPNVNAGPWISLMVRGFAAGTGTSYESISKDFSQVSYSSSRTSKLENRPRYKRWQNWISRVVVQDGWDRFCNAAAIAGREEFPTMDELLTDRRTAAPIEIQKPGWEWVDIAAEQAASEAAVNANQSTEEDEAGKRGKSSRKIKLQRAREKAYDLELEKQFPGISMSSPTEADATKAIAEAEAVVTTADAADKTADSAQQNGQAELVDA